MGIDYLNVDDMRGCPKCRNSKSENIIERYLSNNKINFVSQKKFDGCFSKLKLKFDFYIPYKNFCIEYDGEQHFNKFRFEKNEDRLNERKNRDSIKNIYCQEKGIVLHRINYKENIIERLEEIFK